MNLLVVALVLVEQVDYSLGLEPTPLPILVENLEYFLVFVLLLPNLARPALLDSNYIKILKEFEIFIFKLEIKLIFYLRVLSLYREKVARGFLFFCHIQFPEFLPFKKFIRKGPIFFNFDTLPYF